MLIIERWLPHGAPEQTPTSIVVHAMAHRIRYGRDGWLYAASFLDRVGLSAHALVAPNATVIRCRRDHEGAWHAKGFNRNSLGIEILVPGTHTYSSFIEAISKPDWVSEEQFDAAVEVVRDWIAKHAITSVVRHSDIDPERKKDPGEGFRWCEFLSRVLR